MNSLAYGYDKKKNKTEKKNNKAKGNIDRV